MSTTREPICEQANELFTNRYQTECRRVNEFMILLLIAEWFAGIGFAVFYSPFTWIGNTYSIHIHVWIAILLGGAISGFPILWAKLYPNSASTRHVIAVSQMLWSALLIHLTGGRIETHFHVFASLAILSIYRDWKILMTATVVVAVDHFVRGVFYPLSAFGIVAEIPTRWIEHAAWVIFEVSFLAPGCIGLRNEIRELCQQQIKIEQAKRCVDIQVEERTQDLTSANRLLESKTAEAEKLALVAQYTENAVVISDGESKIEWVNEGFTRITGYKLHEVVGKRPSEFQHGPQSDPQTLEMMSSAIRNRTGFEAEIINYRKNGEPYWMAIDARPILAENGVATRYISIQSDVSKRKSTELSLASAERRIRSLVNNVPGAFYRCRADEKKSLIFMSESIETISGYLPEDFTENGLLSKTDIVHPEDIDVLARAMNSSMTEQEEFEIEYRILDRNQNTKWVWEHGQCLTDDDGALVFDGMIFDITDRKSAEVTLAGKGRIIEESLNEIYIFDVESHKFVYVNRGGRNNIGYSQEELMQMTPLDIKPEFDEVRFQSMLEPLETGEKQQVVFQTPHLRKDGTKYVAEVWLQKSHYEEREVFLTMILDVTDRIENEKKSDRLQRDLVDASRKAGMADVATGVLHNVGNVLNSVNVSASIIRKKLENSAFANLSRASGLIREYQDGFADFVNHDSRGKKLPGYILKVTEALSDEREFINDEFADLLKNVEHIKEIVSVQQSMAKTGGVNQELCPRELIKDLLTTTKGTLSNHNILVTQIIADAIPTVLSDKHKILQILINLLTNSKDSLVDSNTPNATIRICVEKQDAQVSFQIVDNGVGIPVDKLEQVFQYGYSTKQTGHGFGLHSCANAAVELGGTLTASSYGSGTGACFQLLIPINKSNASPFQKTNVNCEVKETV